MKITITARKTTLKDSFKERVNKKLSKLDRYFKDDANANVIVTREQDRETVEVTVQAHGMFFRAEQTTNDRFDSLESAVDSITRQILKNKSKIEKKFRTAVADVFDPPQEAEDDYHVVRTKTFIVKPMDVEEAIMQMNLVGHTFFMFRNAESGEINLVYTRKDGGYGVLEPTAE